MAILAAQCTPIPATRASPIVPRGRILGEVSSDAVLKMVKEWGVEKLAKAKLIVSSTRVSSQMQVVVLDAESRKHTSFIDGWDVFTDFPEFSDQNSKRRRENLQTHPSRSMPKYTCFRPPSSLERWAPIHDNSPNLSSLGFLSWCSTVLWVESSEFLHSIVFRTVLLRQCTISLDAEPNSDPSSLIAEGSAKAK
ncbi:hypothetical protein GGX14DRAFT_383907 [Mycena pura]|uniref:Uncharacterized protein n=1 Tax=Mycena pura TaxID=153505 RepID=A0AAD6YU74_9AGAR|nr:hypothetical protein GGX14DRAFT_383907 [Mycena pura]